MYYYPIFFNIVHKKCVVIGGGKVAERRIKELIKCGAMVHIYSKKISKKILKFHKDIKIYSKFTPAILKGASLVFIATGDTDFNKKILSAAKKENLLLNVSDDPANCSFIVPSIFRKGDLTIAVSTGGKAPALSRAIRKLFKNKFGEEFVLLINGINALRTKVKKRLNKSGDRIKIFRGSHLEKLLQNIADKKGMAKRHIRDYLKKENARIEKIFGRLK